MFERVIVVGQKFQGKTDKVEKWYGAEYSVTLISKEIIMVGIFS